MATRFVTSGCAVMALLLLGCSGMRSLPSTSAEASEAPGPDDETVIYTIKPDPKYSSVEYKNIEFRPGDQVRVEAGGCVNTGGTGKTWKHYLDPRSLSGFHAYREVTMPETMTAAYRLRPIA